MQAEIKRPRLKQLARSSAQPLTALFRLPLVCVCVCCCLLQLRAFKCFVYFGAITVAHLHLLWLDTRVQSTEFFSEHFSPADKVCGYYYYSVEKVLHSVPPLFFTVGRDWWMRAEAYSRRLRKNSCGYTKREKHCGWKGQRRAWSISRSLQTHKKVVGKETFFLICIMV